VRRHDHPCAAAALGAPVVAALARGGLAPRFAEDACWQTMVYIVIETFKNYDALPVYRRFKEKGRLAPEGLVYLSSWVDEKFRVCFQLMETDDAALIDQWMAQWSDIVDFEVFPVITSEEAVRRVDEYL
jgi:hypothetical protein